MALRDWVDRKRKATHPLRGTESAPPAPTGRVPRAARTNARRPSQDHMKRLQSVVEEAGGKPEPQKKPRRAKAKAGDKDKPKGKPRGIHAARAREKEREARGGAATESTCFDGTNWMGSSDQIECEIADMDQKRLQARFAVVYGKLTNSSNNAWLRRKLLEAAGLRPPPAPASKGRPTVHFAGASLGVQSLMALAGPRKKKAKRRPRKAAGDEGEGAQTIP